MAGSLTSRFVSQLRRNYALYTGGFVGFVVLRPILEQMGVPNKLLGYIFLGVTVMLYAGIGILSRTSDVSEYYVAGRRVPAFLNGMAVGADWMSAASFIGLAGTLYLSGYDGLLSCWGGPAASFWWRCCWRPICASSASSPFLTFSVRATAAASRAPLACAPRPCVRSPLSLRRSTAWG